MTDRQPVKQFFGDAEYEFHLPPELVIELERKVGAGIGSIYRRFLSSDFGLNDLLEVLRLGLIGASMEPKEASTLVKTYAGRLSVASLFMAAMPVLDALMTDAPVQPIANPAEEVPADDQE
ncbi:gene transfer agent family protein [Rhizobium sp. P32RR-XVIII]|uniref:gene transfer agent family protein n=1 Tax=Rhizobium sp. P32RR-XVIII TaxID=2726738 RepID=UPI001456B6FF|nr:gene transfer agent family protein [Rhizobium sp. P32RR-XVIII]NLS04603.1 gene transfer agent family protein [Rhizobium sp. P32RR-XVIII]